MGTGPGREKVTDVLDTRERERERDESDAPKRGGKLGKVMTPKRVRLDFRDGGRGSVGHAHEAPRS